MQHDFATVKAQAMAYLDELMEILPMARGTGRLDEWSAHYTKGYMLKLRVMR